MWRNQFIGDIGNIALVTVDGADSRCEMYFNRRFFGHKFNGSGLKYEVAVCIATGDIVWINGAFRCGENDFNILRQAIVGALEEGEMIEADNGYNGEPISIKTPSALHTHSTAHRRMKSAARARHETINGDMKEYEVLDGKFRHDMGYHSACFRAVAVLTQTAFKHGMRPFQVHYSDFSHTSGNLPKGMQREYDDIMM